MPAPPWQPGRGGEMNQGCPSALKLNALQPGCRLQGTFRPHSNPLDLYFSQLLTEGVFKTLKTSSSKVRLPEPDPGAATGGSPAASLAGQPPAARASRRACLAPQRSCTAAQSVPHSTEEPRHAQSEASPACGQKTASKSAERPQLAAWIGPSMQRTERPQPRDSLKTHCTDCRAAPVPTADH